MYNMIKCVYCFYDKRNSSSLRRSERPVCQSSCRLDTSATLGASNTRCRGNSGVTPTPTPRGPERQGRASRILKLHLQLSRLPFGVQRRAHSG